MPAFRARNPYYLRISEKNVLPLYVYLDARHLDWMSDYVLQKVLVDLRPMVLPKLKEETSGGAKKTTVDVHRGDTYQFCYFIRKTEPHSVVVKARHFEAAPPVARKPLPQTKKRKVAAGSQSASKRRKTKGKGRAGESEEEEEAVFSDEDEDYYEEEEEVSPRRSRRSGNEDVEMEEIKHEPDEPVLSGPGDVAHAPIDVDIDEEEEKPKPILKLKYQDFSIYGHCLCIVVEPYPPLRAASRAPAAAATRAQTSSFFAPRAASLAPRAQTPLFLPDDDDERELSVAPFPPQQRTTLPPVPLFHEDVEEDESDNGGMMAFSQAMNGFTHLPAGAADDDDDMDGAVFFGDADEVREL
ncbi:hypothetical protein FB45DRAFT_416523 [Roridomyces roridus]|uniref:Uncharacterized protein n=1 Tax=Roridomyces roridus TaxID=1738132 RepID=A0AAD7C4Y0_9AGAR|nr:hypothetical protein FB45DRAFT_416523 [Roridomyces roridus]